MAPKAADKVFNLLELLEQILLNLDTQELFILQRVNGTFDALINTSKPIRRKMFLLVGPVEASSKDIENNIATVFNPLIELPQVGLLDCRIYLEGARPGNKSPLGKICVERIEQKIRKSTRVPVCTVKDASWRKTLLFSSPYAMQCEVNVRCNWRLPNNWDYVVDELNLAEGVTLEQLSRAVNEARANIDEWSTAIHKGGKRTLLWSA